MAKDEDTVASALQMALNENGSNQAVICCVSGGADNFGEMAKRIDYEPIQRDDTVIIIHHDINPLIDEVLAVREGYLYVDAESAVRRPHSHGELFYDLMHLNAKGNRLIANCIYRALLALPSVRNAPPEEKAGSPGETDCIDKDLRKQLMEYISGIPRYEAVIGAIVVNCNPFTLGHRYLIDYAAGKVAHLYVFVVEEDKSIFPFADRIKLVEVNTADIENVTVVPSGKFIISALTFSEYFAKTEIQERVVDPSWDVELFGSEIAPALGIKIRFAGEEPFDNITRQYNQTMARVLPKYNVEFKEIPRKGYGGQMISASRVRKLLDERDFDAIKFLVPIHTFDYLIDNFR
jgi:[citrate (pro-3S)-lyase] ligase